MIPIILLALIFIQALLFKPKKGYLYCGIFGGSFNRSIGMDIIRKLKILGMFNQTRGEHSCGYFNGDEIVKGVDANKKWFDFVVNVGVKPNEGKNNVFIGHVRSATYGSHTEGNAHPFLINDRLVLAHNGTLSNHWSLCGENDIPIADVHVDSLALGLLIDKVGFKILEQYKGAAALLMHWKQDPGTLYIYHGASRDYKYEVNPTEERPLYMMKAREGVYVSSLVEPLKFIREEGDEEPVRVPHNRVIPIAKGKVRQIKAVINREDTNIKNVTSSFHGGYEGVDDTKDYSALYEKGYPYAPQKNTVHQTHIRKVLEAKKSYIMNPLGLPINEETFPRKALSETFAGVYFRANRYYNNKNEKCHGCIIIDKNGNIQESTSANTELRPRPFHFWNGVLLDSMKSFQILEKAMADSPDKNSITKWLKDPSKNNYAKHMSKYSRYPVTNVAGEAMDITRSYRECFYKDENFAGGCITPLWSDRNYHFKEGVLNMVRPNIEIPGGVSEDFFPTKSTTTSNSDSNSDKKSGETNGGTTFRPTSKSDDGGQGRVNQLASNRADISDNMVNYVDSEQFQSLKESFRKVYINLPELEDNFFGYASQALELFAYEFLQEVGKMKEPDERAVQIFVDEIYQTAVLEKTTIEELMDTSMTPTLDYYLACALYQDPESPDDKDSGKVVSIKKKYKQKVRHSC